MLTRTAIYEGTIHAGKEDEFFRRVRDELEPLWRRFPNVLAVRVQRRLSADETARPIPMILEMDFADQKAIDECLASSIRPESHEATLAVMKLFDGTFYHYVMEATRADTHAVRSRPQLTAADVRVLMAAARAEAERLRLEVAIAIVDEAGVLLALERLDGARLHTPEAAWLKARTAAITRTATAELQEAVAGNPALLSFPGRMPLTGGEPLVHAGMVVGAVGSSGGEPAEDEQVCHAALRALATLG